MADSSSTTQPNAGIVFSPTSTGSPRDVITWHHVGASRVWVHAREVKGAYVVISIEVQHVGNLKPPLQQTELSLRLQLAELREATNYLANASAAEIREIPIGFLLESHSTMLSSSLIAKSEKDKQKIKLVKTIEHQTFVMSKPEGSGERRKSKNGRLRISAKDIAENVTRPENTELRANAKDSIFISSVYSSQVQAGSRQPALRTAKLLGIKTSLVYVAVRTARKKGWLTSTGINGVADGVLTPEGEKEYLRVEGPKMYKMHVTDVLGTDF